MRFSEAINLGTPTEKTWGIFGDPGLLSVTFRDLAVQRLEMERTSNTAEIRGLQGVKVVSAEGIEPSTY